MLSRSDYFLGERFLGSSEIDHHLWMPRSHAFLCATCGRQWASIISTNQAGAFATWDFHSVPCQDHLRTGVQDWGAISGSILAGVTPLANVTALADLNRTLEHVPLEVLQREFNLAIQPSQEFSHENVIPYPFQAAYP